VDVPLGNIATDEIASAQDACFLVVLSISYWISIGQVLKIALSCTHCVELHVQVLLLNFAPSDGFDDRCIFPVNLRDRVGYLLQLSEVENALVEYFPDEGKISFEFVVQ